MSCNETKSMGGCMGLSELVWVHGVGVTAHLWICFECLLLPPIWTPTCAQTWLSPSQHLCISTKYRGAHLRSEGPYSHLRAAKGLHSLGWRQTPRAGDTVWDPTRNEFHSLAPREMEAAGLSRATLSPQPPDP